MPDTFHSSDLQRLRLEPLNQVAALKLKEAGVFNHPAILPVFRLMEWGLSTNVPLTHIHTARHLLRLRHQRDQRAALNYLLEGHPEGLPGLQRKLLGLPPRYAAQTLLDILDMRLRADPAHP